MDGLTFRADPFCCLENGPRIVCRIMADKETLVAKRDDASTGPLECAGKSIIEHIETQLDQVIRTLMESAAGEHAITNPDDVVLWRGQAQGLCEALAIIRNPYLPNIVAIKAEAMERYEAGLVPGEQIPLDEVLADRLESLKEKGSWDEALFEAAKILVQAAPPKVATAARILLNLDEDR